MKTYPDYKCTDLLWLPKIPKEWQTIKIKYAFGERSEKGYPNEPLLVSSQHMGVVPKTLYANRTVEAQKDFHLLKLVRVGDFVISLRSFQGGIEYAYYQGIISPAYTIMISKNVLDSGYFRYLAKSYAFIELLKSCVTGIREGQSIDYSKLKNHRIPLPSRPEQEQIVRFLDWKVSQINRLINAQKKEIQKLLELKRTAIYDAITGRLDNRPKKNSGVRWIGMVPEDWEICRVKNIATITNGSDPKTTGDIPVYGSGECAFKTCGEYKTGPTVLLGRKGATLHIPHFVIGKYWNVDTAFDVHMKGKNDLRWFYYLAQCFDYGFYISQTTLPSMTQTDYYNMSVPVPPASVQHKIVSYLDGECRKFEQAAHLIELKIDTLEEYKARLISDVVTGKIDVRDIEIPEFEFIDEEIDSIEEEVDGSENEPFEEEEV